MKSPNDCGHCFHGLTPTKTDFCLATKLGRNWRITKAIDVAAETPGVDVHPKDAMANVLRAMANGEMADVLHVTVTAKAEEVMGRRRKVVKAAEMVVVGLVHHREVAVVMVDVAVKVVAVAKADVVAADAVSDRHPTQSSKRLMPMETKSFQLKS